MSTDLDAVRKAYFREAVSVFKDRHLDIWGAEHDSAAAHDAGLIAVVEWAMNRLVTLWFGEGPEVVEMRTKEARDALLKDPNREEELMDIRITITQTNRMPNEDRLALADRYDERASYSTDLRIRDALYAESNRIRHEEGLNDG